MKENYTEKEIELISKALDSYDNYLTAKGNYFMVKFSVSNRKSLESVKEKLNESILECRKNIPKSLVNKFDIKKIE